MRGGFTQQALARQPLAGRLVQARDALWLVLVQPGLQEVTEQVVVAEPVALVVERNQEEVSLFELLEDGLAA